MAASDLPVSHFFSGGLATDFGALADGEQGPQRIIQIPFLTRADNLFFVQSGAIKKIGGITKYNSSTIESGQEIRGMYDYVKLGTGGTPARKKVALAGTKILADSNNGTFASIKSGMQDNSVPAFCVMNDTLIISTDNVSDDPQTYDQASVAALGGTSVRFSFSVQHATRLWAAGNFAVPSRLYYSNVTAPSDFAGGGTFDIDPDDGDMIVGLYPFRGALLVFKGPTLGSIHVISGLTPSTFEHSVLVRGIGAIWQNGIFPLPNDVGFVACDGTIRTVGATQKFGDLELGQLSQPINTWLQDNVALRYARTIWASTDFTRGYVVFTLPIGSDTSPSVILMMDYRFQPARFAFWPCTEAWSVQRMSDPGNLDKPTLFLGGNDGYLRKTQQATQGVDGVAIQLNAKTPIFQYGTANRGKTIQHVAVGMRLTGEATITLSVRRDVGDTQTYDVTAGGGAVLGEFILGTDTLTGTDYVTKWTDTEGTGQFREVEYEVSNAALTEQPQIESFHVVFEQSANPIYE